MKLKFGTVDTQDLRDKALKSYMNGTDFAIRISAILTMIMIKSRRVKEMKEVTCASRFQTELVLEYLIEQKQIVLNDDRTYSYIAGLNYII